MGASEFQEEGFVLGIDGGGTKTVCVVLDRTRTVCGRGIGSASNYQSRGLAAAEDAISTAIQQAIASLTPKPTQTIAVEGLGIGLAGAGRPEDVRQIRGLLEGLLESEKLPLKWCGTPKTLRVASDCAIALVGGTGREAGIVTIAGTGSIVYGCNTRGETRRAGGWGYLLGDEGSGYAIALRGLQAAVRAQDGRSGQTTLADGFLAHLGLNRAEELVEAVYRRGWGVKEIAALSVVVDRAAAAGDGVANGIIEEAVGELVLATQVVGRSLFRADEVFEVVTVGGTWLGESKLRSSFIATLGEVAPNSRVIEPRHEPAIGAGLMASQRG
ncbi:MAG: BadF/BadG/BcrA/BcrD ATPase family protein [Cyanobacteriota bacterium]|nr:BadF/BadG/BcrA/BcrD ATPase family protein [Cyanobacteriota bacterium]